MTAGGWMYIGPQGIVHGTYSTILNAGRAKLGIPADGDLTGHLFVSSGLGGMSGAQGKAVEIADGVGIIAEVDASRIRTRLDQGWVGVVEDPAEAFRLAATRQRAEKARHRLSRQHRGSARIRRRPPYAHRFAFGPDLLPCGLRGRLLSPGAHLRRAHRACSKPAMPVSKTWWTLLEAPL